jgi:hypothetical protein
MTNQRVPAIAVGLHGSAGSLHALRWVVEEAALRSTPIQMALTTSPYSTVRRDFAVLGLPTWWRRMVCFGVSCFRSQGGISCSPSRVGPQSQKENS